MKKLIDISKQAEKLYSDFVDNCLNTQNDSGDTVSVDNISINTNTENDPDDNLETLEDLIPYTDDYDLTYLDEVAHKSGHCDEPILQNYWDAQDEDGNYVHPIGKIDW